MARTTFFQATAALSLFATAALAGNVVNYNFNVANGQVTPDGVTRDGVLVNDRFPGPLITANKGDTLKITVNNALTDSSMFESTTIHWHGLFQKGNAEEDGPAFVTQCPIAPNASYTYTIPLNDQSGTYWYHSHLSSQYVDGLRGSIVIYPLDPYRLFYDVDNESTVFTLADWYHNSSRAIEATGNVLDTIPKSGTINGKGRYDPLNITATPDTLYTLKVKQGKRYRLRITNISAIASFRFGIQGHKMTVIEMDGGLTKPIEVDQFDILVGQRYSVILKADQTPGTYWVNAPITNVLNTNVQALLVYEDATPYKPPHGSPWTWTISQSVIQYWQHIHTQHGSTHKSHKAHKAHKMRMLGSGHAHAHARRDLTIGSGAELEKRGNTTDNTTVVLDESKLAPLIAPGAPAGSKPADVVVPLDFGLNFANGRWMINNISYAPPDVPTLLKILSKSGNVNSSDFSTTEHTYTLPRNKVVELVINGTTLGIVHPFHLHGHLFDVVQYGNSAPNYINPPRRDVVGVTDAGVRIQFRTDNPGPWFLHCHIDWHLVEGLAMVFAEAPSDIPQVVHPDPAWKQLCEKYDALSPDQQ